MKNRNKALITSVAWIVMLSTSLAASAQGDSMPRTNGRQDRIVGLWDVQVAIASCAGGAPFATFPALHKYELGGTGQVVPGTNPALLSAHMMVWTHLGGDDYMARFKMYRFDPAGNRIGWIVATNEVSIDADGAEYSGSGVAEFFDNDGNFLMATCPYFTGSRFNAEP